MNKEDDLLLYIFFKLFEVICLVINIYLKRNYLEQMDRFDEHFFLIAKETGGIEGLLNSLFSFLLRRTDYFYECINIQN